jgi:putative protein-disulfide isomerase
MSDRNPTLFYVHDPMCSWCWGFRPVFKQLIDSLPRELTPRYLLGGLAPDTTELMPAAMCGQLEATWRRIQATVPGTEFNFDFWRQATPRRSTWPACRAVLATRQLDGRKEDAMILAIQQAYYLQARNPSDNRVLTALAGQIGLDETAFADLLDAAQTRQALAEEMAQARAMGVSGFPELRLQYDGRTVPVPLDYCYAQPMREAIERLLAP